MAVAKWRWRSGGGAVAVAQWRWRSGGGAVVAVAVAPAPAVATVVTQVHIRTYHFCFSSYDPVVVLLAWIPLVRAPTRRQRGSNGNFAAQSEGQIAVCIPKMTRRW